MILTVISPDKLTLNMFLDFYRTLYSQGKNFTVMPLPQILSDTIKEEEIKKVKLNHSEDKDVIIIPCKTSKLIRSDKNQDLTGEYAKFIPESLNEISTYIVAFDMYSVSPAIIKDKSGDLPDIIERWNKNLERFNKS